MFKLNDMIQTKPDAHDSLHTHIADIRKGKVVYIHPQGRFYLVEFETTSGQSFRETRWFTPEQFAEGVKLKMFPGISSTPRSVDGVGHKRRSRPRKTDEFDLFSDYKVQEQDIDAMF